jgi:hypothetical protein
MIRSIRTLTFLLLLFSVSACHGQKAASVDHLRIGMTKVELDEAFKDVVFLKSQVVSPYPDSNEKEMRAALRHDHHYESLTPPDIVDRLAIDGTVKVYSFLIRRKASWPNGWRTDYLAVFHDGKDDKVIGWAKMSSGVEPRVWRDRF